MLRALVSQGTFEDFADLDKIWLGSGLTHAFAGEIRGRINGDKASTWSSFGERNMGFSKQVPPSWVTEKWQEWGWQYNNLNNLLHGWIRGWRKKRRSMGTTEIVSSLHLWHPATVVKHELSSGACMQVLDSDIYCFHRKQLVWLFIDFLTPKKGINLLTQSAFSRCWVVIGHARQHNSLHSMENMSKHSWQRLSVNHFNNIHPCMLKFC